ncbi:MAG TPA: hypothetical protein VLK34_00380 [Nocardioidaceae bacterium]|nr:hypothetical protein [Nocardioidaceae bacterium]
MKYAQRSTAAIAAAALVGAGGIAAAAAGAADVRSAASPSDSTAVVDKSQRDALSALLHDLAGSGARLDAQLLKAQHDLARQTRELHRQRALSRVPLAAPPEQVYSEASPTSSSASDSHDASPTPSFASTQPSPPPPTHTSTGASGGTGGGNGDDDGDDGQDDSGNDSPTTPGGND